MESVLILRQEKDEDHASKDTDLHGTKMDPTLTLTPTMTATLRKACASDTKTPHQGEK
jgi:hypothetical protein